MTPATQEGGQPALDAEFEKRRADFLQKMYTQMFDDIKVQMQVVWQSVAVVAGTFAVLALVEKGVFSLDLAITLIVLIAAWLIGHVIEASYWYNRNLVIIANIERQFLKNEDLKNIHYYFGKHRKSGAMIGHFRLQLTFGIGIVSVVLLYHFFQRVLPGFGNPWLAFEPQGCLPYLMTVVGVVALCRQFKSTKRRYEEFLTNSPGKTVDAAGIAYGAGHPAHQASPPTLINPPSTAPNP